MSTRIPVNIWLGVYRSLFPSRYICTIVSIQTRDVLECVKRLILCDVVTVSVPKDSQEYTRLSALVGRLADWNLLTTSTVVRL
jgi:hypothetical protein